MSLSVAITRHLPDLALDVAFDVPGGVTAIYGPSGCGKTSTVNAVAGLLRPDTGQIVLNGRILFGPGTNLPPNRRRIGYVFQDARLFPHLTVARNLAYGARFARVPPDATAQARIATMLGLDRLLQRHPAGLSGGEAQRVAIGRALLSSPQLLIMDEPLAALDPARKDEILPYLSRLRQAGGPPILYVSHAMGEIARLADRLVIMRQGRVAWTGNLDTALSDPAAAALIGPGESGALLAGQVSDHTADGLTRVDTPAGRLFLPRITAPAGTPLRLRVLAHEVMLAAQEPQGLSALNILPATVSAITRTEGRIMVQLQLGQAQMLAAITARSETTLGLTPGAACFAVLKTVALIRQDG